MKLIKVDFKRKKVLEVVDMIKDYQVKEMKSILVGICVGYYSRSFFLGVAAYIFCSLLKD
jgi:hypothetical protein